MDACRPRPVEQEPSHAFFRDHGDGSRYIDLECADAFAGAMGAVGYNISESVVNRPTEVLAPAYTVWRMSCYWRTVEALLLTFPKWYLLQRGQINHTQTTGVRLINRSWPIKQL